MIDLNNIEQYRENNRIEAKNAMGGLPHSIWETYSAFANTLGGLLLLGVEEYPDKSLHVLDLTEPERMVEEFWRLVNDPRQASVNILSDRDVRIEDVGGKKIIVISVPRAQRLDRPVYVDGNILTGTYRRSGEGDYRCTREEVASMVRDADVQTRDMKLLTGMNLGVLDFDTLHRYRARMWENQPEHAWERLEDEDFLYKIGAAARDKEGILHPTGAGLLMFGYEYEIIREFPNYFLDYREQMGEDTRLTYRLVSSSGDWSGNLFDFYTAVYERIIRDIRVPAALAGGKQEESPVHRALREALANSIMNADYYGRQGLVIIKSKDGVTLSNPGAFRIGLEEARSGGVSDPRNAVLVKMFNLVNIGRRSGSGIPGIYAVWQEQGWALPVILESFQPERITLSLAIRKLEEGERGKKGLAMHPLPAREALIAYLTDHVSANSRELSDFLGWKLPRVRALLRELQEEGVVVAWGGGKSRVYQLKS